MKFRLAMSLLLALVANQIAAAAITPIPGKGNALSFLHQIIGVHMAKSEMDEVRLYELCASTCNEPRLALQVVADDRPPAGKISHGAIWALPYVLRRIDSVSLEGTTVWIEGWTYDQGSLSCAAVFSILENGRLSESLEDRGCAKKQPK